MESGTAWIGLISALGGAMITLIGTFVNQYFTYRKDTKLAELQNQEKRLLAEIEWEKQKEERLFLIDVEEKNSLIKLFEDCLALISIYMHKKKDLEQGKENLDLTEDIIKIQVSYAKLSVKVESNVLDSNIEQFIASPSLDAALNLRFDVLCLMQDMPEFKRMSRKKT